MQVVKPQLNLRINESAELAKGQYYFDTGPVLVISGEDMILEGGGAVLCGPGCSQKGPASFRGTGVVVANSNRVVIRNLVVRGFALGIKVINCQNVTIEGCDFSDNFTDPDFGWGDGEPYGAVLLENSHNCIVRSNRGNNVWNGLYLLNSHNNLVEGNEFSHCSNVCLKLWQACRNTIKHNNFSWGLRLKPGEVHARDSTSALLEHGSNENHVCFNDFTHGGDGIFVRSLDGVISTGNYFEGNDCSYANNNAVECWSPGNTFVRNTANYSSYGFWMGGSDETLMLENEIAFNGTVRSNAPEPFGNAGVAVVKGSSNHFRLISNHIHDNNGPGVAVGFSEERPAYHWLIQNNLIESNSSHGIYLFNTHHIIISSNEILNNGGQAVCLGENVTDLKHCGSSTGNRPRAVLNVSQCIVPVGQEILLDATQSKVDGSGSLDFYWSLGDGTQAQGAVVRHVYTHPGFYRVALTVHCNGLFDIAATKVLVYQHGKEPNLG